MLDRELLGVVGATFNVLFLSHLDNDHVGGVDKLLVAATNINEVVLPYLGDDDWALHLAAAAATGSLSGTMIDLAADPAAWFGARGVGQVTYVEGTDDEDPDDGVLEPDPVEPSARERLGEPEPGFDEADDDWSVGWTRSRPVAQPGPKQAAITVLPRGSVGAPKLNGAAVGWVLSPFAFKPSAARMARFSAQLVVEFGLPLVAAQYAEKARTAVGRKKLQRCYDAVFAGHNLHSMALYAGPVAGPGKLLTTAWQGAMVRRVVEPGWLSTGDVDLTVNKRRKTLIGYYASYASMIGQLALPHHGSDCSFDGAILTALPNLNFAIAAVGVNSYNHPGRAVQKAVAASPQRSFIRVDENPSSFFRISGAVDF